MSQYFRSSRGCSLWLRATLTCMLVCAIGACFSPASRAAAGAACHHDVQGPFHVQGTRVRQADGSTFVPYGVTLSTLEYYPGTEQDAYPGQTTLQQTEAQIHAIADGWCGNTVRLQIEQDELVGVYGTAFNARYMGVIEAAVRYAEKLGLVVVLNAQTGPGGAGDSTRNEPLPTYATMEFWHRMNVAYAHDHQVVYDLFNEPRPYAAGSTEQAWWAKWRWGGRITYTYYGKRITINGIGEQPLTNYVRQDEARQRGDFAHLIWIEGLQMQGLDHVVSNPSSYLIKGDGPIAYSYHHTATGLPHTAATWDAQFGDLIKNRVAPVVDGEWTNYATANSASGACWADAPTTVPAYLAYLHSLGVGMTVWTLASGVMNSTPGNYVQPSQLGRNWSCTNGLDQGAGQLVHDWYLQNNSTLPPGTTPPPVATALPRTPPPPRRPTRRTYHLRLLRAGAHATMHVTVLWTNRSVQVRGTLTNSTRVRVYPGVVISPANAKTRAARAAVHKKTSTRGHKVTIRTGWVQVRGGVRRVTLKITSAKRPKHPAVVTATRPRGS